MSVTPTDDARLQHACMQSAISSSSISRSRSPSRPAESIPSMRLHASRTSDASSSGFTAYPLSGTAPGNGLTEPNFT